MYKYELLLFLFILKFVFKKQNKHLLGFSILPLQSAQGWSNLSNWLQGGQTGSG